MSRKPLMAGNWKMNLNHLEAIALTQKVAYALDEKDLEAVEVVVLPPFTDIRSVQTLIDGDRLGLKYGAQDISAHATGAFTGEISGAMLAKLGCSYVVVGHSERRQFHAEDDALVNAKAKAALSVGITPIICVGEPLEVRESGTHVAHVLAQLDGAFADIDAAKAKTIVVAYEPVWAIGTGKVASPEDAQEVCAAIRKRLSELYSSDVSAAMRVLYGGSVKASNVVEIMAQPDVDGALVGGASLLADEFARLARFPKAVPLA
jgi:triosephosphate isomerase (TIM)